MRRGLNRTSLVAANLFARSFVSALVSPVLRPSAAAGGAGPTPGPSCPSCASWLILLAVVSLAACVDRLPPEDRRITAVAPIAKLSAPDLWNDYQQNAKAANSKYFGGAIDISGKVTAIEPASPVGPIVMFGQTEMFGIRAILLGDQAADILKTAKVNERLTLRCFCEGKTSDGHIGLRSCIRP